MAEVYRNGLTKLSQGSDAASTRFNIIFIHGLRGHPQRTWEGPKIVEPNSSVVKTRKSLFDSLRKSRSEAVEADSSKVFWPRDLLAKDIPQATIWTYGYNADVIGMFEANNQNSVYQHGRDLKIALERDIDNEHPIAFIVHSLGGIVLKDALRRSERCQQRTKLIMFLGTPHRGSPAANMGQIAAKLASIALQDSNRDVLRSLNTDNKVLNNIHEEFVKFVLEQNIAIHSFQEAKGMTGIKGLSGKIVDDFSSKLDLPTIETVESVDADHRQMARCSRREDETYRKIVGELKSRIRNGTFGSVQEAQPSSTLRSNQQVVPEPPPYQGIPPQGRYMQMPFVPNMRFVGREEKLKELEKRMLIDKNAQRLAIVGLGGIGKTQLARAFCYIIKEHYLDFSVLWVSAISSATFKQDFKNIAQTYSIPSVSDGEQQLLDVKDFLSSPAAGKWLLVVDNADDTNLLRDKDNGISNYLPQNEAGLILFTTRYKELADLADYNILDLEGMSFDEGYSFLEKFFPREYLIKNQAVVKEFLEELSYLPLAIVQASAYIIKNSMTIPKYLALVRTTEKEMIELLSQDFHDNTRSKESHNAVATTWLVSFSQLKKDEPAAADLLFFLAFLENKAIPLTILPAFGSNSKLTRAIGALIGYSFLSKQGDEDDEFYDMHRLVHRAIKIWMQEENLISEWEQKTVSHLVEISPGATWKSRNLGRQYTPHTIRVLQNCKQTDQRAELCLKLGRFLNRDGRYSEAIKWLSECVSWRDQTLSETDPDRLYAQHFLGVAYDNNAQTQEAIEILQKVVAIKAGVLAEDDPARLTSVHALASAYESDGQVDKAIKMLEKIVAIRESVLEEEDSDRLSSQHALAVAYESAKQTDKAIEILEKISAIRARVLVEQHPDRLASQHVLAVAYQANGQVDKAIELLEKIVVIEARVLLEHHPDRLGSQHALAIAYVSVNKLDRAIEMLEKIVAIEARVLAEDSSSRLISQHALATAYESDGQIDKAILLMQHVVSVRGKSLRSDHPHRIGSEAALLRMQDKAQETLSVAEQKKKHSG